MRQLGTVVTAAAIIALSGCGKVEDTGVLDNVPDVGGLTLETGFEAGTAPIAEAAGAGAPVLLPQVPVTQDDLAVARARVAAVNEAIRTVLGHVAGVVRAAGAPAEGDSRTYGPAERCVVPTACGAGGTANLRLRVRNAFGATWVFVLDAQVGSDWKPVLAGWLRRGTEARRGAGRVAFNLDNLREAAPAYPGRGHLLGGYSNGAIAKVLRYHLVGFTPDPAQWPAATAAFRGYKTAAGITRVRVSAIENLYGGAASDDELEFGHLAYARGVGGRAYEVVTNYRAEGVAHGDVPLSTSGGEQYFFGRSCYAPGLPTPTYKEWFLCERGVGPRACVVAQGGVGTTEVGFANLTWQTACVGTEPPELQAPDAAPGTTAEDPSDETGSSSTGLTPEDPPATSSDVTP